MTLELKCPNCEWTHEEADNTPVVELQTHCPLCNNIISIQALSRWWWWKNVINTLTATRALMLAHWLRIYVTPVSTAIHIARLQTPRRRKKLPSTTSLRVNSLRNYLRAWALILYQYRFMMHTVSQQYIQMKCASAPRKDLGLRTS